MQLHDYFPDFHIAVSHRSDGSFRSRQSIEEFLPDTLHFPLSFLNLEHSDQIQILNREKQDYYGDALISIESEYMIGMVVADCYPCVIVDHQTKTFALIHCGWKSLVQNIIQLTIDQMKLLNENSSMHDFSAWIGPGISARKYLHTPPVLQQLLPKWELFIKPLQTGEYSIDLASYIQKELIQAGIAKDEVISENTCTFTEKDTFFSFTRAKKENDEDGRFFVTVWPTNGQQSYDNL